MRILLGDETNRNPDRCDFFIYAGVHFDIEYLDLIDERISKLREHFGYSPGDDFKWTGNGLPNGVDEEDHAKAKNYVLRFASEIDAEVIAVLVSHDVIQNDTDGAHYTKAIRDVLAQYNYALAQKDTSGICALDPIPEGPPVQIVEKIFQHGLQFQDGTTRDLDQIRMIANVSSNGSHASSMIDILLGALGYCVTHPTHNVSEELFYRVAQISKGFYPPTGIDHTYGLMLRPKPESRQHYIQPIIDSYNNLKADLDDLLQRSMRHHGII
jgi:hypothetical protein